MGYAHLSPREQKFVRALFEGKSQRDAAKEAGIAGLDSVIDVAASKLVRRGKVQALMNQAWAKSGATIDETLKQAAELAKRAFCEAQGAENAAKRREAFVQWRDAAALLASIHGKLTLNVSGQLNHHHTVTVTAEAREQLLKIQEEAFAWRRN